MDIYIYMNIYTYKNICNIHIYTYISIHISRYIHVHKYTYIVFCYVSGQEGRCLALGPRPEAQGLRLRTQGTASRGKSPGSCAQPSARYRFLRGQAPSAENRS